MMRKAAVHCSAAFDDILLQHPSPCSPRRLATAANAFFFDQSMRKVVCKLYFACISLPQQFKGYIKLQQKISSVPMRAERGQSPTRHSSTDLIVIISNHMDMKC
jgi:hypothetical protein